MRIIRISKGVTKLIRLAREKLAEKNIRWEEAYTEKTEFLKEQFHDVVGPGSYFRFEGVDPDSESEYYVIVGPARIHKPRAKFFAGVRKLPATYPAGGKYYDSLDEAMKYAEKTWGVPRPKTMKPYTSRHLQGIAGKVKAWKKEKERQEKVKKDDKKDKKDFEEIETEKAASRSYNLFKSTGYMAKQAMGQWQQTRPAYVWWDLEDLQDPISVPADWETMMQKYPVSLQKVKAESEHFRGRKVKEIAAAYNMPYEQAENIYKTYIGFHPDYGGYMCGIGPYATVQGLKKFPERQFRFGYFVWRVGYGSEAERSRAVNKNKKEYAQTFPGFQPEDSDFEWLLRYAQSEFNPVLRNQEKKPFIKVDNLDENSAEWQKYIQDPQIAGFNSITQLNAKGLHKLLTHLASEGGWLSVYQDSIREHAVKEGVTETEIPFRLQKDREFVKRAYKLTRKKAGKMDLPDLPESSITRMKSNISAQSPTELRVNELLKRRLELRQEILGMLMRGIDDSLRIFENVNANPKRKNQPVPPEEIESQLENISESLQIIDASGRVVGQRGYEDLYNMNSAHMDMIVRSGTESAAQEGVEQESGNFIFDRGFGDLKTAIDMARLYFTPASIDPYTKAKMGVDPESLVMKPASVTNNIKTNDLKYAFEEGNLPTSKEKEPEEVEVHEPVMEQEVIEIPEEEFLEPQSEEVEEDTGKILSETLNSLIKISKDLDDANDNFAAEEVHKVIRKYQGELI